MEGSLEVMGLGAVCVREDFRGNNYGKDVVIKSFNRIVRGEFDVALFQTEIPGFYKRYGAKTIENNFYNSQNSIESVTNPWQYPHIMIYPCSFNWPEGEIDLNGVGY